MAFVREAGESQKNSGSTDHKFRQVEKFEGVGDRRSSNKLKNSDGQPCKTSHQMPSEATTPRSLRKKIGLTGPTSSLSQVGASRRRDYFSEKQNLQKSNKLWEDPDFPATLKSLYYSRPQKNYQIVWKRPLELTPDPKFIENGASRFDVKQGELGDCWFLAAVASLSMHKELFERVVPPGQTFNKNEYCGIFRFRFWRFGEWTDVLVDDRLPTYNGQLIYMHSAECDEFWSALLEKAYAKLVGSYEAMRGGSSGEAMEDFTGGITEYYDFRDNVPNNLSDIMMKAMKRSSLMGCSIEPNPREPEAKLANGLVMGHSYSITDIKTVDVTTLIRIRNPWGDENEWNGAWSDKSAEWNSIPEPTRRLLGLTFSDDGEFWMCYKDFVTNFHNLEICHLGPDSLYSDHLDGQLKRRWERCMENGEWKRRVNAGGCRNFPTFWTNPQYRIEVVDPDEDDDEDLGTLVIGLMQKNVRAKRKEAVSLHQIGYAIYQLKEAQIQNAKQRLDMRFFTTNRMIAKSPSFINRREVCGRHKLPPGHYCIVPSTYDPELDGEFLLRIFSERPNKSGELDENTEMIDIQTPPERIKPEVETALRNNFRRIAGEDSEIDAYELQSVLNLSVKKDEFKFDGFSIETCRSMVSLLDYDQSGSLGFEEFQMLWDLLRLCKTTFKKYDTDNSGNFNSYELRSALNAVGYKVSNKVFHSLVMRFSNKQGVIQFDDFVSCCFRLKTIFETYQSQPKNDQGNAVFDHDEFLQCIVYI